VTGEGYAKIPSDPDFEALLAELKTSQQRLSAVVKDPIQ
jgi:hypothetical protein